jgi:hypothetical protein
MAYPSYLAWLRTLGIPIKDNERSLGVVVVFPPVELQQVE